MRMNAIDTRQLLADYVERASEPAFRELVTRYFDLVYSTALRTVDGDVHLAQDAAQTVFVDLASQARSLSRGVLLGGWLHRHTCYVAASMLRKERRRRAREKQSIEMSTFPDPPEPDRTQLRRHLDEAINRLGAADRAAILLRFFENRDLRAVGEALGASEDAAQKRVSRALGKLHAVLKRRGVGLSTGALASILAGEAVAAAPAGLASATAGTVLTAAASAAGAGVTSATLLTLLKIGVMTKLKASIAVAILVTGVATPWVVQHQARQKRLRPDAWRFVGYATPEAALQSAFWAMYTGDLAAALASYTPEKRKEMETEWEGKTGADVSREMLRDMPPDYTLPVDQKRVINDREVKFVIATHDETRGTERFHSEGYLIFINLAGEWKIRE